MSRETFESNTICMSLANGELLSVRDAWCWKVLILTQFRESLLESAWRAWKFVKFREISSKFSTLVIFHVTNLWLYRTENSSLTLSLESFLKSRTFQVSRHQLRLNRSLLLTLVDVKEDNFPCESLNFCTQIISSSCTEKVSLPSFYEGVACCNMTLLHRTLINF